MYKSCAVLAVLGVLALTACGGGGSGPSAADPVPSSDTLFTAGNAWGDAPPPGAETLDPAEFQRRITGGELVLVSPRTQSEQRAAALEQFRKDRDTLSRLDPAQRSPALDALLAQAQGAGDPLAEPEFTYNASAPGKAGTAVLLNLASSLHDAVTSVQQSQDPVNALSAYRLSFETAPAEVTTALPPPQSLQGRPLVDIQSAQATLDAVLSRQEDDPSRPEPAAAGTRSGRAPLLTSQGITFSNVPVKPGSGSDGAVCGPQSASGLFTNFWWPLKRFFTPARDQARRGTCWDFAALAALESRELVVSDHEVNLSEQFMAQRTKLLWDNSDYSDGSAPSALLDNAVTTGTLIPQENYWTYNPASGRPDNAFQTDDPTTPLVDEQVAGTPASYAGACKTYAPGGTCSETSHESPVVCAKIILLNNYVCAYGSVQASASGVKADKLVSVWYNKNDSKFPLSTVRNHLNTGRALIARLEVNSTWNPDNNGFLTDLSDQKSQGGHFVLVVGYVSNTTLAQRLPTAPQGAGGGYFIIKNSWGCTVGDRGLYYVPVDYVKKYFTDLLVLDMSKARSQTWTDEVVQLPRVQINKPAAGQVLEAGKPYVFAATVTQLNSGPVKTLDCSALIWRTNLSGDGLGVGCTPTFTFKDAGVRQVRASYVQGGKDAYDVVSVTVRQNTAPTVQLLKPLTGSSYQAGDLITLNALVGDRDSDSLLYAWRLVLNPGTAQASIKDIPGAAGVVSGTLSPNFAANKALPTFTTRLADFGALCESSVRPYAVELYVTDGFPGGAPGLSSTASLTIYKGSCKP